MHVLPASLVYLIILPIWNDWQQKIKRTPLNREMYYCLLSVCRRSILTLVSHMKLCPVQPIFQTPQRAGGSSNCCGEPLIRDSPSPLVSPPPAEGTTWSRGMTFTTKPQHMEDPHSKESYLPILLFTDLHYIPLNVSVVPICQQLNEQAVLFWHAHILQPQKYE